MPKFKTLASSRPVVFIGAAVLALGLIWPSISTAQKNSAKVTDKQTAGDQDLASQIAELGTKIARLEAALQKSGPGMSKGMAGMNDKKPAMGAMDDDMMGDTGGKKPAMGMMDDEMMGDKKPAMGMMEDDMEMMGMMGMAPKSAGGMSGMKSIGKMQMKAALPSFPGASHIYHVGATDFFLNHPEHINLTTKQMRDLGRLKEKAVLAKTSAQRKIDEAEQKLWTLTSADEPDAAEIEAKIEEIEKLRGDQRMALIRAVGNAAKLLTDEQREALLGTGADETAKPDPHAGHKP
jgi:Spy/CpxP family protein refolding chaperone